MAKKDLFSKPVKRLTMAEQMAETIKELILSGELEPGDSLPTEPELCDQFEVSRAVVRDATRILMALGLVDVKHGAGVFVTESQSAAFGEALLIALRRSGATAWDVEHFEQIILPEVIALAASSATDQEIAAIRRMIDDFRETILKFHQKSFSSHPPTSSETQAYHQGLKSIRRALFKASHNRVFEQLADPLLNLRNLRNWQDDPGDTPEKMAGIEIQYFTRLVNSVATRDPDKARNQVRQMMELPPVAIEVMSQTPVGEIPEIPIPISSLVKFLQEGQ